jgi:CRISPR-associated endonuclease Cas1
MGYRLWWKKADSRKVPPHWLQIRERSSPISEQARRAVEPCNAIMNYAYGVLEGQCRQALASEGFDLACGFLHADKRGRDSLVYDLMELYRPVVDGLVLTFLEQTTFSCGDFSQSREGQCWLHPQLARAVVARCCTAQSQVAIGARQLRARLEEAERGQSTARSAGTRDAQSSSALR